MTDDESDRFAGTAQFYAEHRPDYGEDVIGYLAEQFDLGPESRVLDLGCGTGQIAVPLAAHAGRVVGMDPSEEMLRRARQRAEAASVENVEWRRGSDADLQTIDGPLRLTTIGRAFHWMEQERTLEVLHGLTEQGGGVALVDDTNWFTQGRAVWQDAVYDLADEYLDDLPGRARPEEIEYDEPWDELLADFEFAVERRSFERQREWTVDEIVGYVFSLSYCSPERFDDADVFESKLRALLTDLDGPFRQDAVVEVIAGVR